MSIVKNKGFTLLEILVALFIFSILSLILASALKSVINAQGGTESKAERLRDLQMALLILSKDVTQAVNRPVIVASGKEEEAMIGRPLTFTFTHGGLASQLGNINRSTLQRTQYYWSENKLWRASWTVLDQAPQSQPTKRMLLANVTSMRIQYLDKNRNFQNNWPVEGGNARDLPQAVKITLNLSNWGDITQLYIIPIRTGNVSNENDKASKS